MKRSIQNENDDLKAAAYIDNAGDFDHKKAVWRDIMSQKQGVKSMKQLNNRGNELNLVNGYANKMDDKRKHAENMQEQIAAMER